MSLEKRALHILLKYSTSKDKKGRPDIFHPIAVEREIVKRFFDLDNLTIIRCTALLHDIVEDGDLSLDELHKELMVGCESQGDEYTIERIIDCVDSLTHRKNETYVEYIERLCNNMLASYIKRVDIWHNSSLERICGLDQPTIDRLVLKYSKALDIIDKNVLEFKT